MSRSWPSPDAMNVRNRFDPPAAERPRSRRFPMFTLVQLGVAAAAVGASNAIIQHLLSKFRCQDGYRPNQQHWQAPQDADLRRMHAELDIKNELSALRADIARIQAQLPQPALFPAATQSVLYPMQQTQQMIDLIESLRREVQLVRSESARAAEAAIRMAASDIPRPSDPVPSTAPAIAPSAPVPTAVPTTLPNPASPPDIQSLLPPAVAPLRPAITSAPTPVVRAPPPKTVRTVTISTAPTPTPSISSMAAAALTSAATVTTVAASAPAVAVASSVTTAGTAAVTASSTATTATTAPAAVVPPPSTATATTVEPTAASTAAATLQGLDLDFLSNDERFLMGGGGGGGGIQSGRNEYEEMQRRSKEAAREFLGNSDSDDDTDNELFQKSLQQTLKSNTDPKFTNSKLKSFFDEIATGKMVFKDNSVIQGGRSAKTTTALVTLGRVNRTAEPVPRSAQITEVTDSIPETASVDEWPPKIAPAVQRAVAAGDSVLHPSEILSSASSKAAVTSTTVTSVPSTLVSTAAPAAPEPAVPTTATSTRKPPPRSVKTLSAKQPSDSAAAASDGIGLAPVAATATAPKTAPSTTATAPAPAPSDSVPTESITFTAEELIQFETFGRYNWDEDQRWVRGLIQSESKGKWDTLNMDERETLVAKLQVRFYKKYVDQRFPVDSFEHWLKFSAQQDLTSKFDLVAPSAFPAGPAAPLPDRVTAPTDSVALPAIEVAPVASRITVLNDDETAPTAVDSTLPVMAAAEAASTTDATDDAVPKAAAAEQAPYPSSYMDVMRLVMEQKTVPGIREVEKKPPTNAKLPASTARKLKPWELKKQSAATAATTTPTTTETAKPEIAETQ
eukprot:TRINITY_DN498_c0_g1_i6.p1 TRINITY_DN498_c0_g1~~TRINITY_DN498_c0_g1_i6.p1  ORF type:complete len:850 (-),score=226.36 TRINITY_DN498_c0_g1_i6:1504-4053(-)